MRYLALPPHRWDRTEIRKEADGIYYIVENVWIREVIGKNGKVTFHYYDEGYDINETLCWQYFEAKKETPTEGEADIELIVVEELRYTAEELAARKQKRREIMYAIASDDNLVIEFLANKNFSEEFRHELYQMNIAIGRGQVAMVTAGVGFGFMAMAAAPVLIEGAIVLPSVTGSALRGAATMGVNAAKGITHGMKSAKDLAMSALKDMPRDMLKGTLIDKVGEAIGIPIGTILDVRDAGEFVRSLGKYFTKNPNPKLLTPNGQELDLDSPMQFSKELDPNKGNLSGGKKTICRKINTNTIKSFKSTEINAQNPKAIAEIENKLLSNDMYLFAEPIHILKANNNYYILDGHHRLQAALNINYKGDIPITELSLDEAKRLFPNKVSDIQQGFFD